MLLATPAGGPGKPSISAESRWRADCIARARSLLAICSCSNAGRFRSSRCADITPTNPATRVPKTPIPARPSERASELEATTVTS